VYKGDLPQPSGWTFFDLSAEFQRQETLLLHVQGDLPQPTGWTFFDLSAEFQRQGVPNKHWAACSLNTDYRWAIFFRDLEGLSV
jgi:hypothetical protein